MQVSSILQQCVEDDLLLVAIDSHNITVHIIRLFLKKSCLKINVKKIPTFAGCHLATHPKSRSCGSKGIGLLVLFLRVLEASQHSSGFCLEEVALFIRLDGEHASSRHILFRFDLPHVDEIKNLIINPRFVFKMFCFSNLELPDLMFLFVREISSWLLLLLLFRKWPYCVPTCLLFDCQLHLELQPLCCWSRWSLH